MTTRRRFIQLLDLARSGDDAEDAAEDEVPRFKTSKAQLVQPTSGSPTFFWAALAGCAAVFILPVLAVLGLVFLLIRRTRVSKENRGD